MAKAFGVNYSQLSSYDGERLPSGQVLARFAEGGMNTHWLLTGEGEPDAQKSAPTVGGELSLEAQMMASAMSGEPLLDIRPIPRGDVEKAVRDLIDLRDPAELERLFSELARVRLTMVVGIREIDRLLRPKGGESGKEE